MLGRKKENGGNRSRKDLNVSVWERGRAVQLDGEFSRVINPSCINQNEAVAMTETGAPSADETAGLGTFSNQQIPLLNQDQKSSPSIVTTAKHPSPL